MTDQENGRKLEFHGKSFVSCNRPCYAESSEEAAQQERAYALLTTTFHDLLDENGQSIHEPVPKCLHPAPGKPRVCLGAAEANGVRFKGIVYKSPSPEATE